MTQTIPDIQKNFQVKQIKFNAAKADIPQIHGTFVFDKAFRTQTKKILICGGCGAPVDFCSFCGKPFKKSGVILYCSVLSTHLCNECARHLKEANKERRKGKSARRGI